MRGERDDGVNRHQHLIYLEHVVQLQAVDFSLGDYYCLSSNNYGLFICPVKTIANARSLNSFAFLLSCFLAFLLPLPFCALAEGAPTRVHSLSREHLFLITPSGLRKSSS